jgi:NAD(P)-dependent dehydrogenase (short-subunit alcohol dehydrogenase family)
MSKNILMIGGSHGIGLELARQLLKENRVFIASRTKEFISELPMTHIPFDAEKDQFNTSVLPDELHGFVYSPGSINLKPFKMLSSENFEEDMEINFFSMIRVVKEIIERMAEGSSMVFFSTVAVGTGMPFHTSIAAAKGAVEGFARAMAAEYAPKIRCNVIAPSLVDTPLASRLLNNDRKKEMMAERHPLKRVGKTEDIARLAAFLLSDAGSWITGQTIGVDGGISTLNIS